MVQVFKISIYSLILVTVGCSNANKEFIGGYNYSYKFNNILSENQLSENLEIGEGSIYGGYLNNKRNGCWLNVSSNNDTIEKAFYNKGILDSVKVLYSMGDMYGHRTSDSTFEVNFLSTKGVLEASLTFLELFPENIDTLTCLEDLRGNKEFKECWEEGGIKDCVYLKFERKIINSKILLTGEKMTEEEKIKYELIWLIPNHQNNKQ